MLSYAFYSLNFKEYKKVASEEFDNIYELFSELLIIALNKQIKQGLYRDYIEVDETTGEYIKTKRTMVGAGSQIVR